MYTDIFTIFKIILMLSNRNTYRVFPADRPKKLRLNVKFIKLIKTSRYNVTQFYKSNVLIALHKLTLKRDNVIIKVDL